MKNMLLNCLPELLLTGFLSKWLYVADIYNLDVAMCSHTHRYGLLRCLGLLKSVHLPVLSPKTAFRHYKLALNDQLEYYSLTKRSGEDFNMIQWLLKRGVLPEINVGVQTGLVEDVKIINHFSLKGHVFPFVKRLLVVVEETGDVEFDCVTGMSRFSAAEAPYFLRLLLALFPQAIVNIAWISPSQTMCSAIIQKLQDVVRCERVQWVYIHCVWFRSEQLSRYWENMHQGNRFAALFDLLGGKIRGIQLCSTLKFSIADSWFVSRRCPHILQLPLPSSPTPFALWLPSVLSCREVQELDLRFSCSLSSIVLVDIARAFPMLRRVLLPETPICHAHMAQVLMLIEQGQRLARLEHVDFGWLVWSKVEVDADREVSMLELRKVALMADAVRLWASFFHTLSRHIPPVQAIRTRDVHKTCLFSALNALHADARHRAALQSVELRSASSTYDILPVFDDQATAAAYHFDNVSSLRIHQYELPLCQVLGSNLLRCFPGVTCLHLLQLFPESIYTHLPRLLADMPQLSELELSSFSDFVNEQLVAALLRGSSANCRLWQRLSFTYSVRDTSSSREKFDAKCRLLEAATQVHGLGTKRLQLRESDKFSKDWGYGIVPLALDLQNNMAVR